MLTRRENLLIRPWQERRYIHHRKKVLTALPAVDVTPPPVREHVSFKLKKLQKEAERCARIMEDNFTLLQHLNSIMSTSRVDNKWEEPPPNFLRRVGIYPIISKENIEEKYITNLLDVPTSRKERCFGCHPQRIPKKEIIPEGRVPWEPNKPRVSQRGVSLELSDKKLYKLRCEEDLPQFRGKIWSKPDERKTLSASTQKDSSLSRNVKHGEPQSLLLSKGGLSISVSFPQSTEVLLKGKNEKVIQREFCECQSFPRIKLKKNKRKKQI